MNEPHTNEYRDDDDAFVSGDSRVRLALLHDRMKHLQRELHELHQKFDRYVTHLEFTPVKLLVFGMATLILTSVVAAIIATVIGRSVP